MLTPKLKLREEWRRGHHAFLEQSMMTTTYMKQYDDKYFKNTETQK